MAAARRRQQAAAAGMLKLGGAPLAQVSCQVPPTSKHTISELDASLRERDSATLKLCRSTPPRQRKLLGLSN